MIRILLISRYALFSQGIQSLLRHQGGFEILGCESNPSYAIERIKDLEPDVVIADHRDAAWDPASLTMRILAEGVATVVVGLDLESNTVHLYHQQRRMAKGVGDLVDLIRSNVPG